MTGYHYIQANFIPADYPFIIVTNLGGAAPGNFIGNIGGRSADGTRMYHVILDNDDFHSFEFVVEVLCKALGYARERSFQLTLQAHTSGRAVVWTGPKEVAELKARLERLEQGAPRTASAVTR